MRIVLCYPVTDRCVELIQQAWPAAEVVNAGQELIAQELLEADIFIGHAKVPVDWPAVVARGRLQWIQSSAAGLDHCLVPAVIESPIRVSSASGLFAPQVAEQATALLLGLLRGLPTFFRQMQERTFVRRPTDDLQGKRVGLVGLGGNGRRLVECLRPWGVQLAAVDYFPVAAPEGLQWLGPPERLLDLAAESDILIPTLPLNETTRGCIDQQVFRAMPPDGYLVNVARGGVVCEADLVDALVQGHLRGAGLDVTQEEPLAVESPLWGLPNCLITPHVGAQSAWRVADTTRLVCENLRRFQAGESLLNAVDKRLGFPHPDSQAIRHLSFISERLG